MALVAVERVASPPVTLEVPALGLDTLLAGVTKGRSVQLQVPEDPHRAAWYTEGPAPGDLGPAVLVGHVSGPDGPGVFARLHQLEAGDEIRVLRADGTLATFFVDTVESYAKRDFPTELVYVGTPGQAALRLITCDGYDPATGLFDDNYVVYATLAT